MQRAHSRGPVPTRSRIFGLARYCQYSTVSLPAQIDADLAHVAAYSFRDWPNSAVPTFGAGVYTIWHQDSRFIYVGMSGRGITSEISSATRLKVFTRAFRATPVDDEVVTSSAST